MLKITREEAQQQALKVWKIIEDAVGYGFNSSHAYAVALDSVYGAYLKAEYPLDYYETVLNIYSKDTKTQSKIVKELNHFNIKLEPITFGKSRAEYTADYKGNAIYKGIASIKYLNAIVAEELYELAKNKDYDKNDWVGLLIDIWNTSVDTRQMEILIRLDFFKRFGEKEILLEVYHAMADKKKANTDLYPEFADKEIITEKVKRKTKEVIKEIKVIKRPLKYDPNHADKTKIERLNNLRDYEKAVRAYPPQKIELHEQIVFEKENLGYAISKWDSVDASFALVVDITNLKYTPKVVLYQIKTGEEFIVKVNKKLFWENDELPMLYVGDIVKVISLEEKNAWKNVDGKWKEDSSRKEWHLTKVRLIRGSKKRN